mmetsp:Transcript_45322/g.120205  ORF Transcript_45322/g.120205 Transcript_45322/m.120205 type:complete len:273 (-) Transcript_45322:187-1005(-)
MGSCNLFRRKVDDLACAITKGKANDQLRWLDLHPHPAPDAQERIIEIYVPSRERVVSEALQVRCPWYARLKGLTGPRPGFVELDRHEVERVRGRRSQKIGIAIHTTIVEIWMEVHVGVRQISIEVLSCWIEIRLRRHEGDNIASGLGGNRHVDHQVEHLRSEHVVRGRLVVVALEVPVKAIKGAREVQIPSIPRREPLATRKSCARVRSVPPSDGDEVRRWKPLRFDGRTDFCDARVIRTTAHNRLTTEVNQVVRKPNDHIHAVFDLRQRPC